MNLEKLIKQENESELTQDGVNELFMGIVMGKDVTEIVETSKGKFKIKFPRAIDLEEIGRKTAFRLNGIPAKCFDINTYNLMQMIATLDVLVVEGPAWFEKAKRKNINFSWQSIPSQELIREVYAKAYEFREEVQKKIDSNERETDSRMASDGYSGDNSQPGLFEGLSGESGTNG